MFKCELDATNRIFRGCFAGQVSDEELQAFDRLSAGYAARLLPRAGIVDLSEVTSFEAVPRTLRKLGEAPPIVRNLVTIIVAPSIHTYAMSRFFEQHREKTDPNVYVVRTLEEAWAILGVTAPEFELIQEKA